MAQDADVIVVGAGLAGLVAACELADAGRKVVVLDQEPEQSLGGQAFWSLGGLFLVDSPEQRRMRIRDSHELALTDWLGTAGFDRPEDFWPRRWAEAYVAFAAGDPDTYYTTGSFIAHPPLGKWIIAAGMAAFGTDSAFGWRIGVAVVGILLVALTMLVARHLFTSTTMVVAAGALLAIDGNAIVMSRVSLLDTPVAFFALLALVPHATRWIEFHRGQFAMPMFDKAWLAAQADATLDEYRSLMAATVRNARAERPIPDQKDVFLRLAPSIEWLKAHA